MIFAVGKGHIMDLLYILHFLQNVFKVENIFNVELTYGYFFHENSRINIGFIYCPPKIASFSLFKKVFANLHNKYDLKQPQVIMRDFNFNVHHVKSFPTYLSLDILCVNL